MNIAIDGPAGAGKSTIARAAARKLGYIYVDTGALYRAVACECLSRVIDIKDTAAVEAALPGIRPSLAFIDGEQHVLVNGRDVSGEIRTPKISMAASAVSAIPAVRRFLLDTQRDIAANNDVIMDGRDIGTVILPNAQVKIFLTASPEERARRRCKELEEKGTPQPFEEVLRDIKKRDHDDMTRKEAPLKQAPDAVLADTTDLDLEGAIALVTGIIEDRI